MEFHQADIENLPFPSDSADVVLNNCVINLTPDKSAVYRKLFRVLKPGGKFAISDIVLEEEPGLIHKAVEKLDPCGCVATALSQDAYLGTILVAGFEDVETWPNVRRSPSLSTSWSAHRLVTLVGQKPERCT